MRNFFLERQLRRIERDVSDDLLMILEVGPQYYSTQELYELTDELKWQEERLKKLQRYCSLILASIPIWFCAYLLSGALDSIIVGHFFLYLMPITAAIFAVGNIYSRYHYRNCRHANLIRSIIQQELERRRKDASIS